VYIDHGLLHDLEQLGLHNQHLLKSRWGWRWVGIIVVILLIVLSIVVGGTVPSVKHLKYEH
jgi:hypothetical protein